MQINRGNALAFEALYKAHFPRVRDYLRIYLGDTSVGEDVAQETFLQFWQNPNGYDPGRSGLRAYLFGIARNKAADWWRRRDKQDGPASEVISRGDDSALLMGDALQQLNPDLRNILWLREVEGYSYEELAGILELPVGTVRSRLFSAREQLRRVWKTPHKETL